jgi:UDP-MurNAc hydroxylase
VFLEALTATGHEGGRLLLPGSVIDLGEDGSPVRHRSDDEVERVYGDKAAYLADYKARRAGELAAAHASWGAPEINILERLTEWLTPLLARANHICAGIDGPVLLDVGDEQIIVDFHTREVRAGQGEKCRYEFHVERRLIETCIRDHEIDWVNSLFLSCRFVAHRVGRYNEYLYTFFKCLSLERINYVEGWYAEAETSDEDIELGDWIVQRRCPHLKADLAEFGDIAGDVLVCRMHGWQFDLATGQSMTADGFPIRACRRT